MSHGSLSTVLSTSLEPATIIPFGLTLALSFLLGLELHRYLRSEGPGLGFGTARTLTLVGTAGFLLDLVDENGILYALGLAALALWLALYYRERLRAGEGGLLVPLIAMITYLLGPLTRRTPFWLPLIVVTVVLLLLTEKPRIRHFEDWLPEGEIATVVKFVVMAGIVLPLLPAHRIAPFIPVTYRTTWLAVVVVSGISYLSYIAQAYLVRRRGLLLTGALGGLYSSTATTFVLAEKARGHAASGSVSSALVLATAMMYLRLMALAFILAPALAPSLAPAFSAGAAVSLLMAAAVARLFPAAPASEEFGAGAHPLELKAAVVFAALYVLFATLTDLVLKGQGAFGLKALSLVVGFTDIDPFVLSLFGGHYAVAPPLVVAAVVIATGSNNLLKAVYAAAIARNRQVLPAVVCLCALAAASFVWAFLALASPGGR